MATDVKICGIKTAATLNVALEEGAEYIGLVFFPRSPRHVDIATALDLADRARGQTKIVGLFVDPDDRALDAIVEKVQPDVLQLHGDESSPRVKEIRCRFHLPVFKALKVETAQHVRRADAYQGAADLIIFDAKPPKGAVLPGGNGETFDWRLLDAVKGRLNFMLSGGLRPDNVLAAIQTTGARAVDVSSGVESAPGVKDPELIRRFLRAVKTAKQF